MTHRQLSEKKTSRTRNILWNWAGYVATAVINFLLSPFVVHTLGDVSYGIWVLLGSLVGYLGLLDLGVRGAVTRYIAKFHTEQEHAESTRLASSALFVFSAMGLLAILIAGALASLVTTFFDVPAELVGPSKIVVIVGGISIAISLVSGVYGGIVAGLQRFDYINIAEISIGLLRAIAIVGALRAGMGLVGLAVIQLGITALRGLASYLLSRIVYPQLRTAFRECRRSHMSLIFTFSYSVVILQASGMIILYADSVVIGAFLPLSMVTFFAIAANLTEYARAPITGISHTLSPWASALQATGNMDELQRGQLTAARLATLVALPITLTFILRGETFINLWMGPGYGPLSGTVLCILSLSLSFAVSNQTVTATMMGISRHDKLVPVFLLEAACNLTLSVILVRAYGIIGVAWGTAIPRLVVSALFAPWYTRKVLGTPIVQYWFTVWLRPAFSMAPFAVASMYIELRWPADNLWLYFTQVAMILPIAVLGAWLLSLTPDDRRRIFPRGVVRGLRDMI